MKLLILALSIACFLSCKKEEVAPVKTNQEMIVGRWGFTKIEFDDFHDNTSHTSNSGNLAIQYIEFGKDGIAKWINGNGYCNYGYEITEDHKLRIGSEIYDVSLLTDRRLLFRNRRIPNPNGYYQTTYDMFK